MDGSASRPEGKPEEGNRVKDMDAGSRWKPTLRKNREGWGHTLFQSGFHTETSELVTPEDKSGHAEDHGVGG